MDETWSGKKKGRMRMGGNWVRFTCQWKWGGIYFDCIYSLFLLVATLLLPLWTAAVPELGNCLFVPAFNTILQQLPNKQAVVPLSTWVYKLFTRIDLNMFRRWKNSLWPKANTLDVHTLLTTALSVNCSSGNPLFAGSNTTR